MSKSILVVDDEPNIVLSLEFLMKQEGYEVRTSTNGEEALHAVREKLPDLILLDVMMPKLNGYEVCQAIRQNPAWKATRIVMLTARGRDVEREKGLALGADDYITKPFATKDVVEKVKAILSMDERAVFDPGHLSQSGLMLLKSLFDSSFDNLVRVQELHEKMIRDALEGRGELEDHMIHIMNDFFEDTKKERDKYRKLMEDGFRIMREALRIEK
jgi:DNA-binding response OmpR family regulator